VFGSGVFDLTGINDAPTVPTADGYQPLRTRLGVAYDDDCLELGITWRRDFVATGDARKGNTYQFYFALKNLGFRGKLLVGDWQAAANRLSARLLSLG
jgi:LPS-assembly protein